MKLIKNLKHAQNDKKWHFLGALFAIVWALVQYKQLNRFYAVFLLFFFFVQLLFRKRYFMLLVVSVFSLALFKTPTLETLQSLREKSLAFAWNPRVPLDVIFTPRAGEEVLPDEVQDILFILRELELSSYALSPKLEKDDLIYQRTLEGVFPREYDPNSPYIFAFARETEYDTPDCRLIESREEIELVYCD